MNIAILRFQRQREKKGNKRDKMVERKKGERKMGKREKEENEKYSLFCTINSVVALNN